MKRLFACLVFFVFLFNVARTQVYTLGQSDTLCLGTPFQLAGDSSTSVSMDTFTVGTTLHLNDDTFSDIIDIGFDFPFYDSTYSQLVIGSNGVVSFNTSYANGYCPWMVFFPLPNINFTPNNSILVTYMDWILYYNTSKSKYVYKTMGTAPNRKMIIQFLDLRLYWNNCANHCSSLTLILHENTGEFEIILYKKPLCDSYTGNYGIQGSIDRTGQFAQITPGRNFNDVWSAQQDALKWVPVNDSVYQIVSIPFTYYAETPFAPSLTWANTLGETFPYNPILVDTFNSYQDVGYFVGISSDSLCESISVSDTAWFYSHLDFLSLDQTIDYCRTGEGAIFSTQTNSSDSSFYWINQNVYSDTLEQLTQGVYPYVGITSSGCSYTNYFYLFAPDTLSCSVITTPVVLANDGTATLVISGGNPPYTYIVDDTLIQTNSSFLHLTEGLHTVQIIDSAGCSIDTVFYVPSILNVDNPVHQPIVIVPNPFQERFAIQSHEQLSSWLISDEVGKQIAAGQSKFVTQESLNPGLYFLTLIFETGETRMVKIEKI